MLVTTSRCLPFCSSAWATSLPSGEIAAETDVPGIRKLLHGPARRFSVTCSKADRIEDSVDPTRHGGKEKKESEDAAGSRENRRCGLMYFDLIKQESAVEMRLRLEPREYRWSLRMAPAMVELAE